MALAASFTATTVVRISKAGESYQARIEALAKTLERSIRDAFLAAVAAIRDEAKLQALAEALQKGDVQAVLAMLGLGGNTGFEATPLDGVRTAAVTAALDAGRQLTDLVPPLKQIGRPALVVRFDALNPQTVAFLRQYDLGLIQQIGGDTREGIRAVLQDGLKAGRNPRAVAREVRQLIGLTDRQAKAVQNYRKALETIHEKGAAGWGLGQQIARAPGGAQVFPVDDEGNLTDPIKRWRLRDFRFDPTLSNAVKTGKPLKPEQIDKMVQRYAEKTLKWRSENIARTEALRAANMGAREVFVQAAQQGVVQGTLVRRTWLVAKDERTCGVCRPIPGLNKKGVGLHQPFQTPQGPVLYPPVHPSCRCSVFHRVMEPGQEQ